MPNAISLDDAFVVGVACDLMGGWFLGRGLLAKPVEVAERAANIVGASPPVMAGLIRARADGEFGLSTLALGFVLQAGGYLALIGGAHATDGGLRWPLAIVLALLVLGALVLVAEHALPWRIRVLAWSVARADVEHKGGSLTAEQALALIGRSLGFGEVDVTDEEATAAYVREHFRIGRASMEESRAAN
jgi:hypothetical protein